MIRHRKRVGRDVIGRPEVSVVGVCAVLWVGLPVHTALAGLRGLMSSTDGETSSSDDVQ